MPKIILTPTQMKFFKCQDRFSAFIGGIGSGKTYAGCFKDLFSARVPGSLGLITAPTYPMLRDATLRTFMELAGDAVLSFNKAEMTLTIRGGGEVLFRSADNPDRLRGPNLDWAHIDEGAMCPPGTWEIVIGRLRANGKAGPCWITTTPNGRNWLYQRREQFTTFKARTKDNPFLAPEFVLSLEKSYSGEFAKQELEGEFVSLEGMVYKMFSESVHILDREDGEFTSWFLAMDEGYTNPAVILMVGVDGDGRLHIAREWYERGKLQSHVIAQVGEFCNIHAPEHISVDASAAGLIADLRDAGYPANAEKGRVLDGIQAVQNLLMVQGDGKPRLTVSPSCVHTINEFEAYVWKPEKDEPVKENDHAMDALRYGICGLDKVITGSLVL
jgi:PBSX family phage terminase large subunit